MGTTRDLVKRALFVGAVTVGITGAGDLTPSSWQAHGGDKGAKTQGHGCGEGSCGEGKCGGKKKGKKRGKEAICGEDKCAGKHTSVKVGAGKYKLGKHVLGKEASCGEGKCGGKKKGKKQGQEASCGAGSCGGKK